MGYYTYFTMGIEKPDPSVRALEIVGWIWRSMNENEDFFYPFKNSVEYIRENPEEYSGSNKLTLDPDEEEKWDNYDEEMAELSREFPDVTFYLHGAGEEAGDCWTAWYKNGLSVTHRAEIAPLREEEWGDAAIKETLESEETLEGEDVER